MFQRLKKFKDNNEHCQVPNRYKEDPSLGCWVSTQRRLFKKAQKAMGDGLHPERTSRLEAIGFCKFPSLNECSRNRESLASSEKT